MKTSEALPGPGSIIVSCRNGVELTRRCMNVLRRHTRPPWEFIAIDDGSTDDTSGYLASVRDAADVPVALIANGTSRGAAAAINQGLKVVRGEYLAMLDYDVVVTDGRLDQLIALASAERRPAIEARAGSGDPCPALGVTARHAETGGAEERVPSVDSRVGSGDPRPAQGPFGGPLLDLWYTRLDL